MRISKRVAYQLAPVLLGVLYVTGIDAATLQVIGATGIQGTDGAAGNPGLAGGAGGPGGDAIAVAAVVGDASNTALAQGGHGGNGGAGGDGENPDGPQAPANGGQGGDGGRGGDASATATTVVTVGDASAAARAGGSYGGVGGPGGSRQGTGTFGDFGYRGPSGNATAAATATAPGNVTIDVFAGGAQGGDTFPGDPGIAGGGASLGTVLGTSTGAGNVDIFANVRGGMGSGPGAPGASIHLDNAIDGATSGKLTLYQVAEAGGTEANDAPGGDASSTLTKTASLNTLMIYADATGGSGYLSGSALATAAADNQGGAAVANTTANGGYATTPLSGGRGGDAIAAAIARSAGGNDAMAYATANAGAHSNLAHSPMGTGGNATSTTNVSSDGSGLATTDSVAFGGDGSDAGGNADATALLSTRAGGQAIGGHPAGADAYAFARGGIGTGGNPDGSATAHSALTIRGDERVARANAAAEGGSGKASAEVDIANGALTAGLITVSAPIAGDGTTRVSAYTQAEAAMAQQFNATPSPAARVADYLPYQSGALAFVLPSAAYMASEIRNNPTVAAAVDPSSTGLLYAILGGSYAPDGIGTAATFSSSIALSFNPEQLAGGNTMLLGFLDPVALGNGFDQLRFRVIREGVTVVDETFHDAAAALALFDDHVIDLGNWRADLQGDLDLKFVLDLTASRPGDVFYATFVATTVPLPPGIWLLGTAVAALVRYRRR